MIQSHYFQINKYGIIVKWKLFKKYITCYLSGIGPRSVGQGGLLWIYKMVLFIFSHTTDTATRRWSTWSGAVSSCPAQRTVRHACTRWWWSVGTRRRCDVHTSPRYMHACASGQGLHHPRPAATAPTAHSSPHTDPHTRTSWLSGSRPPTTRLLPTYEPLNVVLAITVSAKLGCKLL